MAETNTVEITLDDELKSLEFGEVLTSGSRYRLVFPGGAARLCAGDEVIFLLDGTPPPAWPGKDAKDPLTLATATVETDGADAYAEINLDTDTLQSFAMKLPIGTAITADVAIHSAGLGENAAIGKAKIRLCRIATNPVTGAAILYKGERGATGDKGDKGEDGKSAYELAVAEGFEGTLEEWLESLKGDEGKPGKDGKDGKAGEPGKDGADGEDGKSAYELAVAQGFQGTLEEWIESLHGTASDGGWFYAPQEQKWYFVTLRYNDLGQLTLFVDADSAIPDADGTNPPEGSKFVTLATAQTITGHKEFTSSITLEKSGTGEYFLELKRTDEARGEESSAKKQIVFLDQNNAPEALIENVREGLGNRVNIHAYDKTGNRHIFLTYGFKGANGDEAHATVNVHPPATTAADATDMTGSTAVMDSAKFGIVTTGWANDPAEGRNNIVHKSGSETIGGAKTFQNKAEFKGGLNATNANLINAGGEITGGLQGTSDGKTTIYAKKGNVTATARVFVDDSGAGRMEIPATGNETSVSSLRAATAGFVNNKVAAVQSAAANAQSTANEAKSAAAAAKTAAAAAQSTANDAKSTASTALSTANTAKTDAAAAKTAANAAKTDAAAAKTAADDAKKIAEDAKNAIAQTNVAHLTGNETIAGVKTFTSTPVLPQQAQTLSDVGAATAGFVRQHVRDNALPKSGNSTCAGVLTFTQSPVVPTLAATAETNQAVNAAFVWAAIRSAMGLMSAGGTVIHRATVDTAKLRVVTTSPVTQTVRTKKGYTYTAVISWYSSNAATGIAAQIVNLRVPQSSAPGGYKVLAGAIPADYTKRQKPTEDKGYWVGKGLRMQEIEFEADGVYAIAVQVVKQKNSTTDSTITSVTVEIYEGKTEDGE